MNALLAVVTASALILTGCRTIPNVRQVLNPVWESKPESSPTEPPIPGIDQASISFVSWDNGGALVVWTDVSNGTTTSSPPAKTKGEGYVIKGHHHDRRNSKKARVDFRCVTPDGLTGTVTINDKPFDLAQGFLFLVSTTGDQIDVRQLSRDATHISSRGFKNLARTDQEIREFFRSFAELN